MPNKYKAGTVQLQVRMQEQLRKAVEDHCRQTGIPVQAWVRALICRELGVDENGEKTKKNGGKETNSG